MIFQPSGGLFKDEREDAVGVAASGGGALEVEVAGGGGEVVIEENGLEVGEGELAHGVGGGVAVVVAVEHGGVAAVDGAADEEDVGRVLVAVGEAVEIAAVPVGGLAVHELANGEEVGAGGRGLVRGERGGSLRMGAEDWCGERTEEGEGGGDAAHVGS